MNVLTFVRTLSFVVGMAAAGGASAVQCDGQDLGEAASLKGLPNEVLAILRNQSNGYAIADRGDAYQATDVMVGERLPHRRFVVAGINTRCALVAIEHGGRGYSVELYRLRGIGDKWEIILKGFTFQSPLSLDRLAGTIVTNIVRDPADPKVQHTTTPLLN